jgi:hypothetical protein
MIKLTLKKQLLLMNLITSYVGRIYTEYTLVHGEVFGSWVVDLLRLFSARGCVTQASCKNVG